MPVVGQPGSKGRSIVEGEWRKVLGELQLLLKGTNLSPIVENLLFFSWEVDLLGGCVSKAVLGWKLVLLAI